MSASAEEGRRYLDAHAIQPVMEELLLELARKRPEDLYGFMSDWALMRRDPKFTKRGSMLQLTLSPSRGSICDMSPPSAVDSVGGGLNRQCTAIIVGRNTSKRALLDQMASQRLDPAADAAGSKAHQAHRQQVQMSLEKIFGDEHQRVAHVSAFERNLQSVVLIAVDQELVSLPLIRCASLCTMAVLVVVDDSDAAEDHTAWEVCLRQLIMCGGVGITQTMVVRLPSADAAQRSKALGMVTAALATCGIDSVATPVVDFGPACSAEVVAAVQLAAPRKLPWTKRLSKVVRCSLRAVKLAVHAGKTYRAFGSDEPFACTVRSITNADQPELAGALRVGESGAVELVVTPVAAIVGENAPLCLFVDGSVFAFGFVTSLSPVDHV